MNEPQLCRSCEGERSPLLRGLCPRCIMTIMLAEPDESERKARRTKGSRPERSQVKRTKRGV